MLKNVTLIGMPGAGKSTIGVILAKMLCRSFLDTDLLIQQSESASLQTIIEKQGLEAFRAIEQRVVCSVDVQQHVIATGGSVVYSPQGMKHLRTISTVFFLNASLEALERRISPMMLSRGIVMSRGETLAQLLMERLPLYRHYAHHEIDCDKKCMETLASEISSLLIQNG